MEVERKMLLYAQEVKEDIIKDLMPRAEHIEAYAVIIQVGDNQASNKYISNKSKLMAQVGIKNDVLKFNESVPVGEVADAIRRLNADIRVTGVMVQLPLPARFDEHYILNLIDPDKDIDCLTDLNIGKLYNPLTSRVSPCTPQGILRLLEYYDIGIGGKDVCIVGRSNIVGATLGIMMTKRDATVTICHSRTPDLKAKTRQADIVICAIGRAKFFDASYFNPSAVVIDVGINVDENGKLCGDVDTLHVAEHVRAISPVPGGVGVMTVCSLMLNTLALGRNLG